MPTNLDRYKTDLKSLIDKGKNLQNAIQFECFPAAFEKQVKNAVKEPKLVAEFYERLPSFKKTYQAWYSEGLALIRQLLPDRLDDFTSHYQKPRNRKSIDYENYRIEDYLQGLTVTRGFEKEKVVGPDAAIPQFEQQLAILEAVQARFESSLFDIRQLVQADLFDSELDAASELLKNRFARAAGALAGVVLEKHLKQVCDNHGVKVTKKDPSISDLNDLLKSANLFDVPQWRSVQFLADIRNLCDHDKKAEPTVEQVTDLIAGVAKITKTVF